MQTPSLEGNALEGAPAPVVRARAFASRGMLVVAAVLLVAIAALVLWRSTSPPILDGHARLFFGLWRTKPVAIALAAVWSALALLFAASSRRALVRFVVATAALAFAWIALEIAGLAGLVAWPKLLSGAGHEQLGTRTMPNVDLSGVAREDLADSWGLERAPIPFRFVTDRHGFRNAIDRESADVYCLGDSFLVAGLVAEDAIVPARLETELARPVMGVALVGLSPQEEAKLLLDSKVPLERRLVLHFVFEGNDLLDSAAFRAGKKQAELPWRERTLLNQLVVKAQLWTQPQPAYVERRTGRIGDEDYRFGWLRSSFEGLDGELPEIARTLGDLRDVVRSKGGEYAVVVIPDKLRVLGPSCRYPAESEVADWKRHCGPLPEYLRAWGEREHVAVLDLTDALRASCERGDVPWFPADTHWNAIGHRVAADAIAAWPAVGEALARLR